MASPGNQHFASCIGMLLFPIAGGNCLRPVFRRRMSIEMLQKLPTMLQLTGLKEQRWKHSRDSNHHSRLISCWTTELPQCIPNAEMEKSSLQKKALTCLELFRGAIKILQNWVKYLNFYLGYIFVWEVSDSDYCLWWIMCCIDSLHNGWDNNFVTAFVLVYFSAKLQCRRWAQYKTCVRQLPLCWKLHLIR